MATRDTSVACLQGVCSIHCLLLLDEIVIGMTNIIKVYTNQYAYSVSTQKASTNIMDDHAHVLMPLVNLMASTGTAQRLQDLYFFVAPEQHR